jgi:N-sulfoglucosamine sulfohydrolase
MQPPSCFDWDHAVHSEDRRPADHGEAVADAIARAEAQARPFFINCNINDPHRPFYGSPGAAEMDHHETGDYKVEEELHADEVEAPSFLEDLAPIRQEFAQYCNSAQRMDLSIGKVLAALAASAAADNTLIIFCNDHGMPFPFSKATVYDSGTRAPVLLYWPGMGEARAFEHRTCNIDILPTVLDILLIPTPEGVDGRSWLPLIRGQAYEERDFLVTHVNGVSSGAQYPMRAIQDGRYSLIFSAWSDGQRQFRVEAMSGLTFAAMQQAAATDPRIARRVHQYLIGFPMALYDLERDPDQRVNLVNLPQHRERREMMQQALLTYMEDTGDPQLANLQRFLSGEAMLVEPPATRSSSPH